MAKGRGGPRHEEGMEKAPGDAAQGECWCPSAPGTKCRLEGLHEGDQVDSCFLVPPPGLHLGGQDRPRDEGLGSRGR